MSNIGGVGGVSHKHGTLVKRLSIIGVGLIGGSLARALRRMEAVEHITGIGRGRANLERAKELGVVDDYSQDIAAGVKHADMVVVAVPMGMYDQVFKAMAGHVKEGCIITDAGSTKQHAIAAAKRYLPNPAMFVAAHPIAGTEQSGVEASFADLYIGRTCILTPVKGTDPAALKLVEQIWQVAGSRVDLMDATTHDDLLAGVSHLPHIAAFALVNAVRKHKTGIHDPFSFAAGGFRDFTRIGSSSPQMWRDIALCNREPLLKRIDALQTELGRLRAALDRQDGEALLQEFSEAKTARDAWLDKHGSGF
ncbi:MAG: prephenate dehydrogenase/arogenate dehydrogenase family protein [Mariprofundaceae bacterium]|nr:prephenate dehydrogenase/arogenate dehydrogenase family protein [Mariprofundaceae bacterium]